MFYAVEHLFSIGQSLPPRDATPPCLQNPTTHYCASDRGVISGNPNTWIDKGAIKSIYDPCPYGYRVPINGSWAGFPSKKWTSGDIKEGAVWQSTWWPAAGRRDTNSATMASVALGAYYWPSSFFSSPTNSQSYYLYFDYRGEVTPSNGGSRSNGFSIRCVQE